MATGDLSGNVPAQSGSSSSGLHRRGLRALVASVLCLAGMAQAERADMTGLSGYEAALKETSVTRQISALERFIGVTGSNPLKTSALEVLVWDYLRAGAPAHAARPANALLAIDSGNAIALAALVDPRAGGSPGDGRDRFQMATRGLSEYGRLQKPVGMTREEFYRLQLQVLSTLDGEAGFGYLGQKNYAAAQQYLQQAVATVPNSGRYVYGLALAMLKQSPPQSQGYWYLARAVNLLRGTSQGPQIAEYARAQYVGAGGSDNNWDRFLIAARSPTSATRPNVARSTTPAGTAAASALNRPRVSGGAVGGRRRLGRHRLPGPGRRRGLYPRRPRPRLPRRMAKCKAHPSRLPNRRPAKFPRSRRASNRRKIRPRLGCNFRPSVGKFLFLAIARSRSES